MKRVVVPRAVHQNDQQQPPRLQHSSGGGAPNPLGESAVSIRALLRTEPRGYERFASVAARPSSRVTKEYRVQHGHVRLEKR